MEQNKKLILESFNTIKAPDIKCEHFSISSILDQVKGEFNKGEVVLKTYNKHFNNPKSKYYQKTVEQILEMWKESGSTSLSNGSLLDDYIGMVLRDEDTSLWELDNWYDNELLKHKCSEAKILLEKLKLAGFDFICREQELFYILNHEGTQYLVHGRFDALFSFIKDNNFFLYLIDWKNTEKIEFTNRFQKLLGPCKSLDDASGNLYILQLYFYKYCLEYTFGIKFPINISIVQFPSTQHKIYASPHVISKELMDEILLFGIKKLKLKRELKKKESSK